MKALVTGVAGFIGSQLAESLIQEGADVIGVDSFTDYYAREIKIANLEKLSASSRFQLVEGSIEAMDLSTYLRDCTHVFHLAAQAGVRTSWGMNFSVYTTLNINATQTLLEACLKSKIERFVYASSSSVYGEKAPLPMREDALPLPISPYGLTKLAAEHLCMLYHRSYGLPTVSLRYFTVYGPRQRPDMAFHRFLTAAISGSSITLYGDGQQTRDFTFIQDVVDATIAASKIGRSGNIYNIGGGSPVTLSQSLDLISSCIGRTLDIKYETSQRGDMRDTYADITRARQDLNYEPAVSLADGIQAEYQWMSSTKAFS